MTRTLRAGVAASALIALAGCTTMSSPDARDPWEPLNRATFEFNDGVDRAFFKPVAEGYRFVMPGPARTAVTNFFSNLNDPWVALNQLMQGKVRLAIDDFGRFVWNSTIGLLGLIDVATDMGLPKHKEDFGQTLGVWGVGFGPYFVVPILGPSSVRDGSGLIVDAFAFLPWQIPKWADFDHRVTWQWSLTGLDLIQTRAGLLDASNILEEAALDRYAFVRDAYFQRRRYLIYDGDPPPLPAKPESSRVTPPAGPVAPGAISLVPASSPPPAAPSTVLVATPGTQEASPPTAPAQTAAEPFAQPGEAGTERPPEPARESEASPLAVPPPGPLVEPKIPVNYPAVLTVDAPRAVAAR
jgi:phospholipid-binding lipoprotein MlaA